MSESNNYNMSNGFSFGTLLFLVFLILQLTKTIDWSWWWVTSPLWLPWSIVGGIILLLGLISVILE